MGGAVCCCSKKAQKSSKTHTSRRFSISMLETKVFEVDELGKEATQILIDIENINEDLLETKEEMLKISEQKTICNALVAFIFAVAAVKKTRFKETGFQISESYPFIQLQINEPSCKELNAFKASLAKYLGVIHNGIQKLDNLYSELLSVVEKLKKEIPNCLNTAKERGLPPRLASKAPSHCWANVKQIESRKHKIDKIRRAIFEERENFINSVIPQLNELVSKAEEVAQAESNETLISIKAVGKRYSVTGRRRNSTTENRI